YFYSQKLYPVNYEIGKILKMISLVMVFIGLFYLINDLSFFFVIKIFLLISFPIILYFLNFYEKVELDRLEGAWHKWKNPQKWKSNIKKNK
ncbi:MAG: hypothetical protein ACLFPJ_06335, partial [Candidatus Woesearchaeota archaeon]